MKLKVGQKLNFLREDRKMTQNEFADLLGMSPSAYARLERGETQADLQQIIQFSETLNVPLHELLPDTITFHNHNNGKGAGVIFGNYIVNVSPSEHAKILENENEKLQIRIKGLEEKIELLQEQIVLLKVK